MVPKQLASRDFLWKKDLIFPGMMWLASRMVIWSAMFWHTREPLAQIFFLGGDTYRTIIGVADPGHNTAFSNHAHNTAANT